jgi:hypothetical protein
VLTAASVREMMGHIQRWEGSSNVLSVDTLKFSPNARKPPGFVRRLEKINGAGSIKVYESRNRYGSGRWYYVVQRPRLFELGEFLTPYDPVFYGLHLALDSSYVEVHPYLFCVVMKKGARTTPTAWYDKDGEPTDTRYSDKFDSSLRSPRALKPDGTWTATNRNLTTYLKGKLVRAEIKLLGRTTVHDRYFKDSNNLADLRRMVPAEIIANELRVGEPVSEPVLARWEDQWHALQDKAVLLGHQSRRYKCVYRSVIENAPLGTFLTNKNPWL